MGFAGCTGTPSALHMHAPQPSPAYPLIYVHASFPQAALPRAFADAQRGGDDLTLNGGAHDADDDHAAVAGARVGLVLYTSYEPRGAAAGELLRTLGAPHRRDIGVVATDRLREYLASAAALNLRGAGYRSDAARNEAMGEDIDTAADARLAEGPGAGDDHAHSPNGPGSASGRGAEAVARGAAYSDLLGTAAGPDESGVERWTYVMRPLHDGSGPVDIRTIGYADMAPPNVVLHFDVVGGQVTVAAMPWVFDAPASRAAILALLGEPTEAHAIGNGQVLWWYIYRLVTQTAMADGSTLYRHNRMRLQFVVGAREQIGAIALRTLDSRTLRVLRDNEVANQGVGAEWPLRADGNGGLVDIGLPGLAEAEDALLTFGHPDTDRPLDGGGRRWVYPLSQDAHPSASAPVLSLDFRGSRIVRARIYFPDGLPDSPAGLKTRLGTPQETEGPDLFGNERWTYRYLLRTEPPFRFGPEREHLETPLSLTFDVRGGVRVDPLSTLTKGRPRLAP